MAMLVIVTPVVVLCIIVARDSYEATESLAASQARNDVTLVDVYLRTYIDKYLGILKTLASEQAQRSYAEVSDRESMQTLLDRVALDHPRVYAIVVLDGDGKVVESSRRQALGMDCSQSAWWGMLSERHAPVVSDFEDSPTLGGPVVVLAVPVPGSSAVVALTLNTSTMSTVYEGLFSAGVILLTDTKGVPIVESNRREMTVAERNELAKNSPILPIVRGATGVVSFRDVIDPVTGRPVIGAGMVDPEYGWSVIATQEYATVLGPVQQGLIRTWITLGLSLLASFVIAVLLIGRGPMRRVVLPEISGGNKAVLDVVYDHLRQQADSGLYGEVRLRFRGGHIYKATISRESVFD